MEYIKSAVQQVAQLSGLTSVAGDEETPKCNLYKGKLSAKVALDYIELSETVEENVNSASGKTLCIV